MTVNQTIVTALDAALKTITTVDGNVFEWRDHELNDSELPAIIYRDIADDPDPDDDADHYLSFEIIAAASGNTSPADMRELKQEILTAVATLESDDSLEISGITYDGAENQVEKTNKKWAASNIKITVNYYTDRWTI